MQLPEKAAVPTMYFIGVTTGKSSIMKVFPLWAKELGLKDVVLKGIDLAIHAPEEDYRAVARFIKEDPLSLGALVTTHKIDMFNACRDLFDEIDPYAEALGEVSCLSKRDGKLRAHAKDPISSGLALEHFVPKNFWKEHGGEVLLMGAGGSALAMSMYLCRKDFGDNVPRKITISNRSTPRLQAAKKKLAGLHEKVEFAYVLAQNPKDNDRLVAQLPPYSLIVNATGLGKDAPGSPITDDAVFPENSLVWEINYRGELDFMHQALRQKESRNLHVEDGWIYFIHGWTQVISEVFNLEITGERLKRCAQLAESVR